MLGDLELIEFTKRGRLEAYKALVSKYKDRVYNIAFSFTANADESEDIAQRVFLKAYVNLASFSKKSAFSTWLYRIGINECYDSLNKPKNAVLNLDAPLKEEIGISLKDLIEDEKQDTEKLLLSRETQDIIRKAIASLPKDYKAVLILRDMEDMSYEEIGQVLKISEAKVKIRLFRSRNKLKQAITDISPRI
jgi:RNA polymerase sigma-70 factor (ECF subfamily)